MDESREKFLRGEMLLGREAMERLRRSHVAVFGLGGVGSWCAEALARSGVGALTLVDQDTVGESNINRQLCADETQIGRSKVRAMEQRLRAVNHALEIHPLEGRYEANTRERFFQTAYDYVVDAIDLVACKVDLILTARERGIPVISALGTGNKLDAQRLRIDDLAKTSGCPLARVVRRELRRRGVEHHMVVFSDEPAREAEQREAPPPGRRSVPGSVVWVPAVAGLLLAQHVVLTLAGEGEVVS